MVATSKKRARERVDAQMIADSLFPLSRVIRRLNPQHVNLAMLSVLGRLKDFGPQRVTDLANLEAVSQPSMTQTVLRLEREGLVERHPSPEDGRVNLVALAPAGEEFLVRRRLANSTKLGELLEMLSKDERDAITAAVPALVHLTELGSASLVAGESGVS